MMFPFLVRQIRKKLISRLRLMLRHFIIHFATVKTPPLIRWTKTVVTVILKCGVPGGAKYPDGRIPNSRWNPSRCLLGRMHSPFPVRLDLYDVIYTAAISRHRFDPSDCDGTYVPPKVRKFKLTPKTLVIVLSYKRFQNTHTMYIFNM